MVPPSFEVVQHTLEQRIQFASRIVVAASIPPSVSMHELPYPWFAAAEFTDRGLDMLILASDAYQKHRARIAPEHPRAWSYKAQQGIQQAEQALALPSGLADSRLFTPANVEANYHDLKSRSWWTPNGIVVPPNLPNDTYARAVSQNDIMILDQVPQA